MAPRSITKKFLEATDPDALVIHSQIPNHLSCQPSLNSQYCSTSAYNTMNPVTQRQPFSSGYCSCSSRFPLINPVINGSETSTITEANKAKLNERYKPLNLPRCSQKNMLNSEKIPQREEDNNSFNSISTRTCCCSSQDHSQGSHQFKGLSTFSSSEFISTLESIKNNLISINQYLETCLTMPKKLDTLIDKMTDISQKILHVGSEELKSTCKSMKTKKKRPSPSPSIKTPSILKNSPSTMVPCSPDSQASIPDSAATSVILNEQSIEAILSRLRDNLASLSPYGLKNIIRTSNEKKNKKYSPTSAEGTETTFLALKDNINISSNNNDNHSSDRSCDIPIKKSSLPVIEDSNICPTNLSEHSRVVVGPSIQKKEESIKEEPESDQLETLAEVCSDQTCSPSLFATGTLVPPPTQEIGRSNNFFHVEINEKHIEDAPIGNHDEDSHKRRRLLYSGADEEGGLINSGSNFEWVCESSSQLD